jgi:hypothetical protein
MFIENLAQRPGFVIGRLIYLDNSWRPVPGELDFSRSLGGIWKEESEYKLRNRTTR